MAGYMGKILRVDLSNGKFQEEPLSKSLIHDYIGGRGCAKMLYDDLKSHTDPLVPTMK